jgi:hypothetical protein
MADKPCNQCRHYDSIKRGTADTRRGWCAAQSTYPAVEQRGQAFPSGVKRAAPGELAKPIIVIGSQTIPACTLFRGKK